MNKMFLGGFGAGFAVAASFGLIAYYIYSKRMKKKTDEKVEEAVEKVLEQLEKEREEKKETEVDVTIKREPKKSVVSGVVGVVAPRASAVSYESIIGRYNDPAWMEHPAEEAFGEITEEETINEYEEYERMVDAGQIVTDENRDYIEGEEADIEMHSGKRPKLITWESWMNDKPNFDKIQLAYYTGENGEDGCLVDIEADEEIFDEAKIVGDCLDKFGFRNNDEDVIYVRNFDFGADYEVSKYVGVWKENEF